jgi:hypothetical protein
LSSDPSLAGKLSDTQETSEDRLAIMAAVAMTELLSGSKPSSEPPPSEHPSSSLSTLPSPSSATTPALSRPISMVGSGEAAPAAASFDDSENVAKKDHHHHSRKRKEAAATSAPAISPDNSSIENSSLEDNGCDATIDDEDSHNDRSPKRSRAGSIGEESPVRKLESGDSSPSKNNNGDDRPPQPPPKAVPHGSLLRGLTEQLPQGPPAPPPPHHYHHNHHHAYRHPPVYPPPPYGLPPPQQHHGHPYGHPPLPGHNPYGPYHAQGPPPPPHHLHHLSQRQPQHHAPYPLSHLQSYKETIRVSGLPKSLSFRKICSKCGRTRAEHGELGFGNKCTFTDCGKCGALLKLHDLHKTKMGILCTLAVDQGAVPGAAEAYDRKIRALAARAELQKTLLEDKKERTEKLAHHMVARAQQEADAALSRRLAA